MKAPARIAIIHEWLTAMRGGEKVVEALCGLFPQADLYTLLHIRGTASPIIERMPVRTSFIQNLPFACRFYRHYLPLFPAAVSMFSLADYDLVISSHHCVAKGVRTQSHTLHLCYCHTPMRYLWNLYDEYFSAERAGFITRTGARIFREPLRRWDVKTARNPDAFIANSENVRRRIQQIYHREADVIYPPVNVASLPLSDRDDGYFLVAGALVPYKRVDLAVQVFNANGRRLVVAGDGPELGRLKAIAKGNVEFAGWQTDEQLRDLYAGCRALIFPGEEDFGIVPVEAMACGKPVIAYGKGGALETVVDGSTGLIFPEQTADSMEAALRRFNPSSFQPEHLRTFAMRFDRTVFTRKMEEFVRVRWESRQG